MQQLTINSKKQLVIPRKVKVAGQNCLESSYGAMKHAGSAKQSVKQIKQMRAKWDIK